MISTLSSRKRIAKVEAALSFWANKSDAEVMKTFLQEAQTFIDQIRSNGTARLPTMGLSGGEYWKNSAVSSKKLLRICGFDTANAVTPPKGLLLPGPLSDRWLQEWSLCFLWFNERFFSRASGGGTGKSRALRHLNKIESSEQQRHLHSYQPLMLIMPR